MKMKWCFLINNASFIGEFFGKIARQVVSEGDECLVVVNSKIAEYDKKQYFPKQAVFFSKVDWCLKNWRPGQKEFGELSWKEFFTIFDRFTLLPWNYEYSVNVVSQLYKFLEYFFETEKPDIVVGEPPAGLFGQVAWYFARKYRVPSFGITASLFDHQIEIYDTIWTNSQYEQLFQSLRNGDISQEERTFIASFLRAFLTHEKPPLYIKDNKFKFNQIGLAAHYFRQLKKEGKILFRYFLKRNIFFLYDYESEAIVRHSFAAPWNMEMRQFRMFFQKRFFRTMPHKEDRFYLFPLHVQPEASTLVRATYYIDQFNTIKNIAFSLPFPCKLYVKEHPSAIGTKPDSFYQQLQRIPNIVLIAPEANVQELIKKSQGVITLTSTVGFEAALAGKRVYVLGDVFYIFHPLCRKIQNFEELRSVLRADFGQKQMSGNLEDINMRCMASYIRNTIPGNIVSASKQKDPNNYRAISAAIKQRISSLTK